MHYIYTLQLYTTFIHYIYTLKLYTTFIHYNYTLQLYTSGGELYVRRSCYAESHSAGEENTERLFISLRKEFAAFQAT